MKSRLRAALAFLEERSGVGAALRRLAGTPITPEPGAPRWRLVPGKVLLLLILLQIVTGTTLAIYYSPGTTSSWGSVFNIEQRVVLGSFVRGLHAFGAGAVVIALLLHGVEAGLRRAYRSPHQLSWWLGLVLVPVVAGFALTGYLLPWDQRGYWATQVASGIMAGTPIVGPYAAKVFLGGADMGNLTLTRFYALHISVLPITLLILIGVHLMVWRRNALRAAPDLERDAYWPRQVLRDLVVFVLVFAVLATLAAKVGAGLDAPADPNSDYPPRPEWYFAPLRELLKTVPEPWGSLVVPGLVFLGLASLPLLDRRERDDPGRVRLARAFVVVPLVGYLALLGITTAKDQGDAEFQRKKAAAAVDATLAKKLAQDGIPPAGAGAMLRDYPPRRGARLFEEHCNRCHRAGGQGGHGGADLTGFLSVSWLRGLIVDPEHARYFGKTKLMELATEDRMPKLDKTLADQATDIATFVRSLDPSVQGLDPKRVAAGRKAYFAGGGETQSCASCHSIKPWSPKIGADAGPNLHGYGSAEWLRAFVANPKSDRFYHVLNKMPAYGKDLSPAELDALVVHLRGLDGD